MTTTPWTMTNYDKDYRGYPTPQSELGRGRIKTTSLWDNDYLTLTIWLSCPDDMVTLLWRSGYLTLTIWLSNSDKMVILLWRYGYVALTIWLSCPDNMVTSLWQYGYFTLTMRQPHSDAIATLWYLTIFLTPLPANMRWLPTARPSDGIPWGIGAGLRSGHEKVNMVFMLNETEFLFLGE